jgi:predicted negative regulator of RcsB-dependent stress response
MNTTTSEAQQSEFIEALNQTEVGAFFAKHLKLIISLIVLVFVGLIGWGIYSYQMDQKRLAASEVIFQFKQETMNPFMAGKISVEETMENFSSAYKQTSGTLVGLPTLVELADELVAQDELDASLRILNMAPDMSGMPYAQYFIATRKAIVLEDLGDDQQALQVLEQLRDSSAQLLSDKIYLDLGRLYRSTGDVEKARASFQHVLDNMAQNEFATLARLYLGELNAEVKE